ncbi:alpha/beta fold hydrolase [Paenibacillus arenilitoris]|uniref:Alpha/beta hydrolase n=1 Tax=Paenibacillus arenilitoris TaxID=2772299 RepID=A0A927CKX6_9BACL|nr:alpha/beta hydrolase [Paenibacillus arenilitoris]MBD2869939.1 alpha/beta hydrolase [Paenibacillus arenilitoris]
MGYFVEAKQDVKIFVEDVNPAGEHTLLFIHGWPADHRLFEYQFNVLPAMGFRCVAIDLRGFGHSDKPWEGYSYDCLADDVRSVVDALHLRNFTLVGHSVGGAISIRYMGRHGGHGVSKLILLAAAAPSFVQRLDFPYGLSKDDVDRLIEATENDRPKMLRDLNGMFFFRNIGEPFADWFFQINLLAAGYSTTAVLVSLREETLFGDVASIRVPTLILQGVHDEIVKPQLAAVLHKSIPGSKLVWLGDSGHGLFWEQKEKVNEEIIGFVC